MSKANKRERQRLNREQRREYENQLAKRRKAWKTARTFAFIALPVIALGVVLNLTKSDDTKVASAPGCTSVSAPDPKAAGGRTIPDLSIDPAQIFVADVATNCGAFTITLDAAQAPQTVNNFVTLARDGFYDGLPFHRVQKDFVIQGGDPKGDGTGGPGYTLPDEPPTDGYSKGSVAMARSARGTSGSQFFVVTSTTGAQALGGPPYQYSLFGQVTSGITTIDRINRLGTADQSPKQVVVIKRITITETAPATP